MRRDQWSINWPFVLGLALIAAPWIVIAVVIILVAGCTPLERAVYLAEAGAIFSGEKPEAAGGDAAINHFVEGL